MTTCPCDLDRFGCRDELLEFMRDFDGIELSCEWEDERGLIPHERVYGVHLVSFPNWLDFYLGNEAALIAEFGSIEKCREVYGGADRSALLEAFRRSLRTSERYGAEYVVFHVSNATIPESFTMEYAHSDEAVIDATVELVNELFADYRGNAALLFENLWQPGLTMLRPDMTARLLDGVRYANKGIMLDTGHLLHTNPALTTQEEGVAYINAVLDAHGGLCRHIRGVHLHQSLTGEYALKARKRPPALAADYDGRVTQMFWHAFSVDGHKPFTCEGVAELIERIAPQYLTFEFISESREQLATMLAQQRRALGW